MALVPGTRIGPCEATTLLGIGAMDEVYPLITVVISRMGLAHSKITAQGQVSVPARVRQRLGVGPGSVLEWDEEGDQVIVRKAGRYSSEDIHRALFTKTPRRRTLDELKTGIRHHVAKRHASR